MPALARPVPPLQRLTLRRDDAFPRRAEALGFTFHTPEGREYWARDACYALTPEAIAAMEAAAQELAPMLDEAAARIVARGDYAALGFTARLAALVEASHRAGEPSLYGRFDFRLAPDGSVKLYEYNAETPAALLEAATVQLAWFEDTPEGPDTRPGQDQWSAIDEALVARWPALRLPPLVHFAAEGGRPDEIAQVAYLMATAEAAGHTAAFLPVEEISWREGVGLVEPGGRPIEACFKLYPWDWLAAEAGGALLPAARTRWIEPARRMLQASKAMLAELWAMAPGHPLLLPAALDRAAIDGPAIGKPALGLEGIGMRIDGVPGAASTAPAEGLPASPLVWQQWAPLPEHAAPDGPAYPVMGVWMAGDAPCGLGIREGAGLVTTLEDRFVPHVIL